MNDAADQRTAPAISVIIPTRNRPVFLRDALRAVRAGEWQDFEILVIDQSDSTETRRIVAEFGDDRLRYHWLETVGACHARNVGICLARGALIAFLDDDCWPRPDWLKRIAAAFAADPELQFIFGALEAPPHDASAGGYPEYRPTPRFQASRSRRKVAMVAAGANMSCRRAFLQRIGGFDEVTQLPVATVKNDDSSMNYKVFRSGATWLASADIAVVHVNGFRPHAELWPLFREYTYACGANLGRFARRGDWSAVWYFALDQGELVLRPVASLLKLRRPAGLRDAVAHFRGFIEALRLPGVSGYVDGRSLQRLGARLEQR